MRANWRHWAHLIALRTARDLYILVSVGLLNGFAWLDRHQHRR